jgi:hypothetical protein
MNISSQSLICKYKLKAIRFTQFHLLFKALITIAFTLQLLSNYCCRLEGAEGPPTTMPELLMRMYTFHRSATQENFFDILNGFQRLHVDNFNITLDPFSQTGTSISEMSFFILYATECLHLTTEGAPDSLPLSNYRATYPSWSSQLHKWLNEPKRNPNEGCNLWMGYYCTGDSLYLDNIFSLATNPPRKGEGDTLRDAGIFMREWARKSYKWNVTQWPEILLHAKNHANLGDAFATECVEYAAVHPEMMHK